MPPKRPRGILCRVIIDLGENICDLPIVNRRGGGGGGGGGGGVALGVDRPGRFLFSAARNYHDNSAC